MTRIRRGDLADRAIGVTGAHLDSRDRAWLQELVFGTARLRGRIDHYLFQFVRGAPEILGPEVLDVLRLGAYQLLVMDGVPAYAAVSQSVELIRAAGTPRAAGLVNGVLQSLRRGWRSVEFPAFETRPIEHLVTWGSHPRWLVERWATRWSVEEVRDLVEHDNQRPDLYIRPVRATPAEVVQRLDGAGIGAEPVDGFPDSVRILPPHGAADALGAVPAIVQDPAASMVARFAGFGKGARVLDLSAAPGGKTTAMADFGALVTAHDASFDRIGRVRENVERVGLAHRVGLVVGDARRPPVRSASGILLDAPCTGTGTLRRHPDGRWRISEADLSSLVGLQRELLLGAVGALEIGGILVYSTCSLEPEENEAQIEWLLERRPDLRLMAPASGIDGTMLDEFFLRLLPHRHGFDGAFAARLERTE